MNGAPQADQAEALEAAAKAVSRDEARGSLPLWFAVLGSPLAWAGHLGANYSLEEWFACAPSTRTRGEILGLGVDTVSVVANTAMAALAAASGLVALLMWRRLRNQEGDERTERARWMAFAGMVEAALFLGIIVLGYLPLLTLGNCETTP